MTASILPIGIAPRLGQLPDLMHAQVIRPDRFGEPASAMRPEQVAVPRPGPDEVLVYVMAAGLNYNGVWASRAQPIDPCAVHGRFGQPTAFHIGGSEASGVVWAVGERVAGLEVGQPVIVHPFRWNVDAPEIAAGGDPVLDPSFHVFGYESNWGSFAQFCLAQAHQCIAKPPRLTWEEAASSSGTGGAAYRMLRSWPPHTLGKGDRVLVWGGAGGVGAVALQLCRLAGARAVAVVSSPDKVAPCLARGAVGTIDRTQFPHWGPPPSPADPAAYDAWLAGARGFGRAFWNALGERRNPTLVVEHPGEDTLATSLFVCDAGGMVVICGGTTGYDGRLDLRYLWMRQKRLQGSHGANDAELRAFWQLVADGAIDAAPSRVLRFDEIPAGHQLMADNHHPPGNMVALVGAPEPGLASLP